MRRREFILALGGAATAWPLEAGAQQSRVPVIGVLRSTPVDDATNFMAALAEGLKEFGYVVGQNVMVDYRSTETYERLPSIANDFVRKDVTVIVGSGATNAPLAAKAATTTMTRVMIGPLKRCAGQLRATRNFGIRKAPADRIGALSLFGLWTRFGDGPQLPSCRLLAKSGHASALR